MTNFNNNIVLSLCIPTNGISEWVLPVIDSIYCSNIDKNKYEVIVTDNGNNLNFKEVIRKYTQIYSNLIYEETESSGFLNQIDSFKLARGKLIKFINHRMKLKPEAIKYFINFAEQYQEEMPVVYFSNGVLSEFDKNINVFTNFDEFVLHLKRYSSWSAGVTIWNKDISILEKLNYNKLFPHTDILFLNKNNKKYIIDNTELLNEIHVENHEKKGTYNLFYAFAVEYPGILFNLMQKGFISEKTFITLKNDILDFLAELYINFILRRKKSSYIFDDINSHISIFFSIIEFYLFVGCKVLRKMIYKPINILKRFRYANKGK